MRIVAQDAFKPRIMLLGIDTRDPFSLTSGIGQTGVTTEAKFPAPVDRELCRIIRMFQHRAVAVFTGDYAVVVLAPGLDLFPMAFAAVFMHLLFAGNTIFSRL